MGMGTASLPLHGVRVLELHGEVAVRYCGRLLARLGADVVRVGAGDDTGIGYAGEAGRAYGRWLDDGKRRAPAIEGSFDLVLAGQDAASVAAAEANIASTGGPTLVAIWWFAPDGPYADWPATDEVVLALSGLAYSFGEPQGPPTLAHGHAPQLISGADACGAALAALLAPSERRPRRVDIEVFGSTMCLSETGAAAAVANRRAISVRMGVNRFVPTYPASSYRTADGWIGITCLTPAQWSSLCHAIDRPDLATDPEYATAFRRLLRADEVDAAIAPAVVERTTTAWLAVGDAGRIPITPMPEPGDLPGVEHWRERGCFAPVNEVDAPTLPYRMRFDGHALPRWQPDVSVAGPLSGLRVVDLTMGWAGPLATRTLGDLGADVIKVESATHPDWWRGWEAGVDDDPPPMEVQPHFNAMNRNKRGVAFDLTSDDGRDAALRLIASADVVIDNFAAGVLDTLGLGPEVQRRVRPGVVSVSMPAFGSDGPLSGLRAYGSTVEQASGLPFVNGHSDWSPSLQHVAFGDPIAGIYAVTAVLAALVGRPRLGGADIDLAQVACLFEMAADAIVAAQVDGGVARTGNRRARAAPCCVVATAGDDEWLAVSVDGDDSWRRFCDVLGVDAWRDDEQLTTVAGRNARAGELEYAVAAWAASLAADDAAYRLRAGGVPAAPVKPAHVLSDDPHLAATGYWQDLERQYVGRHVLGAPAFRLDGERPPARRPAPTLGEHTAEVLAFPQVGAVGAEGLEPPTSSL